MKDINNKIISVISAVTIAFSTGIVIRSLVSNIILPLIWAPFINKKSKYYIDFPPISYVNVNYFIKDSVSWIFVIVITFLTREYLVRRVIFRAEKPTEKPTALDFF